MKRLKVLISAHELSPDQGSECAVGWNLVTRIARYHDVTVLYARGSQFSPDAYETAIRKYYTENKNEFNIKFIPVPQPKTTLWLAAINKRISRNSSSIGIPFLYFIGYRLWQKSAYRTALSLLDSCAPDSLRSRDFASLNLSLEPFVLCHHLTSVTFREPGYLWKLPIPFIWGPTGGTTNIPIPFYPYIGLAAASHEAFRAITNRLTLWFSRKISRAIKKNSLIYAFSAEDQELFQNKAARKVEVMLDAGCEVPIPDTRYPISDNRFRVLWCGQLIKRKALDILLKALAGDVDLMNRIQLIIVGDGPLRGKYEKLIKKLFPPITTTTTDNRQLITFTGWLPRAEVFAHMQRSDLLVHTSYREAASSVIPEALSCGLPVICHDISGMSIAITDDCGIKIPLKSYQQSIIGFREALWQVAGCGLQVGTDLRWGALHRAEELSWDSMAERIANDYNQITGNQ